MQNKKIDLVDWLLLASLVILSVIVVSQYIDARAELETSRAQCYAEAGRDYCENVR